MINGTVDNTNSSSLSENGTYVMQPSLAVEVLRWLYRISLPLVCLLGMTGNILAFFVFISKPLRRTSCSWYLAARSISDGAFLLATFLTWFSDVSRFNIFHKDGFCQLIVFSTFIFAFLSVWLTVVVTMENYVRICRPFSVQRFCGVALAQKAIFGLVVIGIILYNYPLWTNSIHALTDRNNVTIYKCVSDSDYGVMLKWLSFVDMGLTLFIPFTLIIVLMVAITFSLVSSLKRQTRLQGGGSGGANNRQNGQSSSHRSSRQSASPQAKVTRMLFAVSFFFILLNGPSHIIRMKMAISDFLHQGASDHFTVTIEKKVQLVFQIIYYMSFAVNLVIYLTCGDNFRKQFIETYFYLCLRHSPVRPCSEMTAMTTVVRTEDENQRTEEQSALLNAQENDGTKIEPNNCQKNLNT